MWSPYALIKYDDILVSFQTIVFYNHTKGLLDENPVCHSQYAEE